MRVAVFGGTGFVGRYLLDALIAGGHAPSVLAREGSEAKVWRARRCHIVTGDIGAEAAIAATLDLCDAAIYNIGILREFPKQGITFEELQFQGLVRVVDECRRQGISRLLLMSANGVESATTRYQRTKLQAEQYAQHSPLEVTIFRPSVIFGPPRGAMEFATQLFEDMVLSSTPAVGFHTGLSPGSGAIEMSPVHVQDVAQAFVKVLQQPSSFGRVYQLGGPEILSWPEMIQRILDAVGREKRIIPMPIGMMKLAATMLDWLPAFPVTRDQLTMLAEGNTAGSEELERLIGRNAAAFNTESLAYLAR